MIYISARSQSIQYIKKITSNKASLAFDADALLHGTFRAGYSLRSGNGFPCLPFSGNVHPLERHFEGLTKRNSSPLAEADAVNP